MTRSPRLSAETIFLSCGRSARTPEIFSRNIMAAPAALRAASWPSRFWSVVLTLA